ncbi:hypothetical protein VIGAN_08227600, partial [Vigna angularis var. angularis]
MWDESEPIKEENCARTKEKNGKTTPRVANETKPNDLGKKRFPTGPNQYEKEISFLPVNSLEWGRRDTPLLTRHKTQLRGLCVKKKKIPYQFREL